MCVLYLFSILVCIFVRVHRVFYVTFKITYLFQTFVNIILFYYLRLFITAFGAAPAPAAIAPKQQQQQQREQDPIETTEAKANVKVDEKVKRNKS